MHNKYEPWDTLFFRDGKPFSMGEDSWASSIFPPWPSTVYGALRSAYLGARPNQQVTIEEDTASLKIAGIHLWKNNKGYIFPIPADCHLESKKTKQAFVEYKFSSDAGTYTSAPYQQFQKVLGQTKRIAKGGFLSLDSLNKYLEDPIRPDKPLMLNDLYWQTDWDKDLFIAENKIGLGRDNATRSAQEGMLYRVQMQRWKDLSLIIGSNLETLQMKEPALMGLGGEGKAIYARKATPLPDFTPPDHIASYFKLYFLSPALFENGWLPKGLKEVAGKVSGKWKGVQLELIAAFTERGQPLGGFDIKKKRPKPMRLALAAGSVFYFKALDTDTATIKAAFHNQMVADFLPEQGFGHTLVGALNHSNFKNQDT